MSRADALRKLLALSPLYRDEIYLVMGGCRETVDRAIHELETAQIVSPVNPLRIRTRYRLAERTRSQEPAQRIAIPKTEYATRLIGDPWNKAANTRKPAPKT